MTETGEYTLNVENNPIPYYSTGKEQSTSTTDGARREKIKGIRRESETSNPYSIVTDLT